MAVVIVAGFRQQVPGPVIFGSANPDVEVGIDPRTGNQPLQLPEAVRLVPGDGLVDRDGLYFWIGLQSRVEAAQKFPARFWVVLPSVFSVEDDRNHGVFSPLEYRPRGILDVLDEVISSFLSGHSRVHKPDEIGEAMVAKNHAHPRVALLVAIDVVEALGAVGREMAASVPGEIEIERPSQHAFVGCHPFDSLPARKRHGFFRDASLRGPESLGTDPEQRLVRIQRAFDLETGVFRTAEPPRWQAGSARAWTARRRWYRIAVAGSGDSRGWRKARPIRAALPRHTRSAPVSYTHLTLPT